MAFRAPLCSPALSPPPRPPRSPDHARPQDAPSSLSPCPSLPEASACTAAPRSRRDWKHFPCLSDLWRAPSSRRPSWTSGGKPLLPLASSLSAQGLPGSRGGPPTSSSICCEVSPPSWAPCGCSVCASSLLHHHCQSQLQAPGSVPWSELRRADQMWLERSWPRVTAWGPETWG